MEQSLSDIIPMNNVTFIIGKVPLFSLNPIPPHQACKPFS